MTGVVVDDVLLDIVLWLACLVVGHRRTDWTPAVDVTETYSWEPSVASQWTTNAKQEVRFCLRCHSGYESRFA